MWVDPILEDLYAIRKDMAVQFNYDVRALGEYCKAQQKQSNLPLVSLPPRYVHPTFPLRSEKTSV